jgi:hypothetical protein
MPPKRYDDFGMNAIETTGIIDERRQLHLDSAIPITGPVAVRVLILVAEPDDGEEAWVRAAARNPAFDFLKEEGEDLYTRNDGQPFHDQG